jgi:hypothetical protein
LRRLDLDTLIVLVLSSRFLVLHLGAWGQQTPYGVYKALQVHDEFDQPRIELSTMWSLCIFQHDLSSGLTVTTLCQMSCLQTHKNNLVIVDGLLLNHTQSYQGVIIYLIKCQASNYLLDLKSQCMCPAYSNIKD